MGATVQQPADEAFVVYSHIGASSVAAEPGTADGRLVLRDDLRGPAGLLAAPQVVLVLDSAATATLPLARAIPTRVGVEVFDPADDVAELRLQGRVRRYGRTQLYYEARIEALGEPDRLVAYGSVSMAVTGPPAAEYIGHAAASRLDDVPREGQTLVEAFEGRATGDGRYEIGALTSRIGFGRLHAGVMSVMAEAAATDAARPRPGAAGSIRTTRLDAQLLAGGRTGPFAVVPEVLATDGGTTCRVEVLDRGAGSRLIAVLVIGLELLEAGPCTRSS